MDHTGNNAVGGASDKQPDAAPRDARPPGLQPMPSAPRHDLRVQTVCLLILSGLGLAGALYVFSPVLIPFVLAVFLTLCLMPIIDLQTRWLRISPRMAIVGAVLIGAVVLAGAVLLGWLAVDQILASIDNHEEELQALSDRVRNLVPAEFIYGTLQAVWNPLFEVETQVGEDPSSEVAGMALSAVTNGVLVLIYMIFLIAGMALHRPREGTVWFEVESRIKRYVIVMVFISGTTGILVGATLTLLNVELGWLFGVIAFVLNFIPNIGSIVATLLPLPIAWMDPELSPAAKVLALVIPGAIQFTIGNILHPKFMGNQLQLHPVVVLLSLIFFSMIWGIIGMFLAVPITAIARLLMERFDYTRTLAHVMAGHAEALAPQVPPAPTESPA